MKLQTYALASLALWLLAIGQALAQTTAVRAVVSLEILTDPFVPTIINNPVTGNPSVTRGPRAMAYSHPDTGVVVGSGGYVVRTVDGGRNWSSVDSIGNGNPFFAIKVLRINGWAHWVAYREDTLFISRDNFQTVQSRVPMRYRDPQLGTNQDIPVLTLGAQGLRFALQNNNGVLRIVFEFGPNGLSTPQALMYKYDIGQSNNYFERFSERDLGVSFLTNPSEQQGLAALFWMPAVRPATLEDRAVLVRNTCDAVCPSAPSYVRTVSADSAQFLSSTLLGDGSTRVFPFRANTLNTTNGRDFYLGGLFNNASISNPIIASTDSGRTWAFQDVDSLDVSLYPGASGTFQVLGATAFDSLYIGYGRFPQPVQDVRRYLIIDGDGMGRGAKPVAVPALPVQPIGRHIGNDARFASLVSIVAVDNRKAYLLYNNSELYALNIQWIASTDTIDSRNDALRAQPLTIYPNPANQAVTVELPAALTQAAELRVLDATGREVLRQAMAQGTQAHSLDIATLPAGLYTLRIEGHSYAAQWQGRLLVR